MSVTVFLQSYTAHTVFDALVPLIAPTEFFTISVGAWLFLVTMIAFGTSMVMVRYIRYVCLDPKSFGKSTVRQAYIQIQYLRVLSLVGAATVLFLADRMQYYCDDNSIRNNYDETGQVDTYTPFKDDWARCVTKRDGVVARVFFYALCGCIPWIIRHSWVYRFFGCIVASILAYMSYMAAADYMAVWACQNNGVCSGEYGSQGWVAFLIVRELVDLFIVLNVLHLYILLWFKLGLFSNHLYIPSREHREFSAQMDVMGYRPQRIKKMKWAEIQRAELAKMAQR